MTFTPLWAVYGWTVTPVPGKGQLCGGALEAVGLVEWEDLRATPWLLSDFYSSEALPEAPSQTESRDLSGTAG